MNFLRRIGGLLHFDHSNWQSIVICFVVAIIFWVFNALDKDYTTNLSFPIRFEFDRSKYVPVEPLPDRVLMNIKGNGWDILRRSLNIYATDLTIALQRPTEKEKIIGASLPILLTDQLKDFEINQVITDTLHLHIDTWETQKVRVTIDPKQFTYAEGFGRWKQIVIMPDSVEITGPKQTVEALHDSLSINVTEYDLDSDFSETIEVESPNREQLTCKPPTVDVFVDVVEWEQIAYTIRLDISHAPEDIHLDSVHCILRIPKEETENLQHLKKQPKATLDLRQWDENREKVKPQVVDLPAYAQLLQIDSIIVKSY